MLKKTVTMFTVVALMTSFFIVPAKAVGQFKWWDNNVTGFWFQNGIICFPAAKDVFPGMKFNYSYKLGQSKKFVSLGGGISLLGDTQVNSQGEISTDENDEMMDVCNDGSTSIAFVAPKVPEEGGAYIIRLSVYGKSGKILWTSDSKLLKAKMGVESTSNFFTNPPSIFFTSETYAYISPSSGVKAYTSKGTPRNACLIIYDIAVKGGRADGSIFASDLISSAQGGFFGANVRSIVGQLSIPTAIKCAPWVATYLW